MRKTKMINLGTQYWEYDAIIKFSMRSFRFPLKPGENKAVTNILEVERHFQIAMQSS